MSFTKTLLAGVAFSALTAASATAFVGPVSSIHLAGNAGFHGKGVHHMKSHHKTNLRDAGSPKAPNYTYTISFTYSFATSSVYKNPISLPAYTWYNTDCSPLKEKIKYTKDSHATIKKTVSTGSLSNGACPGDTFTFYGGTYTLEDKKAKSDDFVGKLTSKSKNNTSGYNLILVENFHFTFTK